jgi:hypothetical protein
MINLTILQLCFMTLFRQYTSLTVNTNYPRGSDPGTVRKYKVLSRWGQKMLVRRSVLTIGQNVGVGLPHGAR